MSKINQINYFSTQNYQVMKHTRRLLAILCCLSFCIGARAQSITGDDLKQQFIADWTRAKSYTDAYLSAMPADKYGFKAVDSIRSFAQQMLHLAAANYYLTFMASGATLPHYDLQNLEKRSGAQTPDSVAFYVNASYDFALAAVKALDPAKYGEPVSMHGNSAPRYVLLMKAFEHQTHHRGQATIYIRLLGIKPPNEQLF